MVEAQVLEIGDIFRLPNDRNSHRNSYRCTGPVGDSIGATLVGGSGEVLLLDKNELVKWDPEQPLIWKSSWE